MVEVTIADDVLVAGSAGGVALILTEPLSLWGGLNPETGLIIDQRHPQWGEQVTDRVLVMPCGRGSSSASSILLEAVRLGTAPAAILLQEADGILALGAVVARELYGVTPPVLVLNPADYAQLDTGHIVTITENGQIWLESDIIA
jgi:predicted aconitase with swiveling domain